MNLVPFNDTMKLPASLASAFNITSDVFSSGQKSGFPVISIKGKVFHIKRGDELTLVTKPDAPDEPAASLELIILKTHPGTAKTYYSSGYVEGSTEKPDCYSNDGVAPEADSQHVQAKKCAVCPHNQWGSRITEDGKKAKSCADVKRLAVAPAGQINDPMLLRIPATTLKPWDQYVELLKKRGCIPPMLVTKIGFDYTVAHPALTFKPVGLITDAMAKEVQEIFNSDVTNSIIGGVMPEIEPAVDGDAAPETAEPEQKEEKKPAATRKAAPKEEKKAEAPKEETSLPEAVDVDDDLASKIDGVLAELGFDDDE